jgi:hypothetical protein
MRYYKYTVFDGQRETTGIMCGTVKQIITVLVKKGYYVRDIRAATQSDMKIEKLKHFRDKLGGSDAR